MHRELGRPIRTFTGHKRSQLRPFHAPHKAKPTDAGEIVEEVTRADIRAELPALELGVGEHGTAQTLQAQNRLIQAAHHFRIDTLHALVKARLANHIQVGTLPPDAGSGQQQTQDLGASREQHRNTRTAIVRLDWHHSLHSGFDGVGEAPIDRRP